MATQHNGGSANSKGWRGQTDKTSDQPRHRWQMTAEELRETTTAPEDETKRVRFVLLLLLSFALLGVFLAWILLSPARTPMLILTESVYPASFPPNPFAEEDANRLEWLDEKNLSIYRENSLANLDQALSRIESEIYRNRVLMIYISAHGGVDNSGQPCLIPSDASPLDSSTWLPVSQVLERLAQRKFSQSTQIVLFLDCQKVLFEPRLGLLHNQFAGKVQQLQLETLQQNNSDRKIPRIAILCSTSSNQVSHSFVNQHQTIFAETLFTALSGKADLRTEGGNSDGVVSLEECYRYLQKNVTAMARSEQDRVQTPTLTTSEALRQSPSPRLALAVQESPPIFAAQETGPAPQWRETIAKLWRQFERISPQAYLETHPDETARLQQLLLRLESWSVAGKAYEPHAISLATLLREHLNQLEARTQNNETFLDADQLNLRPEDVPELYLSQSLSSGYDERLLELESAIQTCLVKADRDSLLAARNQWISSTRLPLSPQFHWIDLLLREGSERLWNDSQSLKTLLEAEIAARKTLTLQDLRVTQLCRQELESADTARRDAEDLIAVDSESSVQELRQRAEAAVKNYVQLEQALDARRQGIQLCNQIDSLLTWSWELLAGLSNDELLADSFSSVLSPDVLQQLQAESEKLRTAIDAGDASPEQYEELSNRFDRFQQDLRKFFETVQKPEDLTLKSVRLIARCLESPLISSDGRAQLWKSRLALLEDIRKRESLKTGDESQDQVAPGDDSTAMNPEQLALLNAAVASVLLSNVSEADRPDERLMSLQELSVTSLQARLREELLHRYHVAEVLLAPDEDAEYSELLADLKQWDYKDRQVAAWNLAQHEPGTEARNRSGNRSLLEVSSVARTYWRFLMQQLLLLETDRATADMWGMKSISGKPFFQAVSEQLLSTSERLLPLPSVIHPQIAARRKLVADRLELLQNRMQLRSDKVTILAPGLISESRLHLEIQPVSEEAAADFSWPSGRVTITLEDSSGRCSLNSLLADWENFPAFGTTFDFPEYLRFSSSPYFDGEQKLSSRLFWRGHEVRDRVPFVRTEGGRTETTLTESHPTTLNVLAEVPQPTNILFILDVSQSMSAKTSGQPGRSRWEVALGVLNEALAPLIGQSHLRVGVLAYGHRAGWNPQNPDELLYQPNLKDSTPPGLLPLEDVEILLPPGPLTPQSIEQLQAKMSLLVPWGETPLYLAIREAVELVPQESPTPTQMIVLTDGVNRQRSPADLILTGNQKAKLISAEQLASALANQSVQLNVVGFELSTEQDAMLQLELRDVITRVGGEYFPAVEAGNLLPLIQGILGPREYEVSRSFNFLGAYPLGQQSGVEQSTTDRRSIDVSVRSASAQITNDERRSIQLYYNADRYELTTRPFRTDLTQTFSIPAASNAPLSGLRLGVHQPRFASSENDGVRFAFSLQSNTNQFVPRPEVFLVHATAVDADGQPVGRDWFYFDPQVRADFTVPLWQLRADSWPAAATHIVLEAYISWNPANYESEAWTISDLATESIEHHSAQRHYITRSSPEAPATVFLAEQRDVNDAEWPGFFLLRSVDEADATPAWSSRHVFDRDHGIHLQTFTPLKPDAGLSGSWNVEVIRPNPAETLKDQRIVSDPIQILSSGEFLQVLP